MCKHLDVSSALSTASEVCNLLTYCWQDEPFQKLLKDYVFHSITTHVSDLFEILQTALFGLYNSITYFKML